MNVNLKRIPERHEIPVEDTWDLSSLFPSDEAWGKALGEYEKMTEKLSSFKGTLARSAESLAGWMDFSQNHDILIERLHAYAHALWCEDERCDEAFAMMESCEAAYANSQASCAWAKPELLAIPEADIAKFLEHPRLAGYRVYIGRILRLRPHTLSEEGERIVALYEGAAEAFENTRLMLVNVDMNVDLGSIETGDGEIELGKDVNWRKLMRESPDRDIRRKIYEKDSLRWESIKTTLAGYRAAAVKLDVIRARACGFPSARAAELFPDNIGEDIYDNLIATVGENLDPVHRYHGLCKRTLGLSDLRAYDLHVPLVGTVKRKTTWDEAVGLLCDALRPLGGEYVSTLCAGLLGRWADRYANQGKANRLSCFTNYGNDPRIIIQYNEEVLDHIGCLAHESAHAMHHCYGSRSNPFRHYRESDLEGETAAFFHEELLFRHMMKTAGDDKELRLHILSDRVGVIRHMLYIHTMYAEFAHIAHRLEEDGVPLTLDIQRSEYNKLLAKYRGSEFVVDANDQISHYHTRFGLYAYATGICAAMALADRVLGGGESERADYLAFLKSGGSRFPIDALKIAGVDMSKPEPIQAACRAFAELVDELERLL